MKFIRFPEQFKHERPPIQNVNEIILGKRTTGQKAADFAAAIVGSWKFLIIQSTLLSVWGLSIK